MQKIVFGITGLTLGGAERVLVDIANELSEKFDITIFTLYGKGEFEKELRPNVNLVNMINKSYKELTKKEKIRISLNILFNKKYIYNKYIKNKFDTEIAFLEGPITRVFSVENKSIKKIAWVHNDIGQVFGKNFKAKIKKILDKNCYSEYNEVVFVSNDNKKQFEKIYKLNNNKIVIPNYISSKRVIKKSMEQFEDVFETKTTNFLTVARLVNQKAIDRLIKIHSKLIKDGFNHKFYIIGDGPEANNLKNLIKEYNVENTFILLGKKNNPYPYIRKCDIFALLSYYEGLPMTILEAKVLEKPILITNTASREAVEKYEKSYITDNTDEGVYEGIKKSLEMLPKWKKMQERKYIENYNIIKQIEKLVKNK